MPDDQHQGPDYLGRLTDIGISLSSELNCDRLLEKIVEYATELTNADASTLYLMIADTLHFEIMQNSSLGVFKGGTTGHLDLPPVELKESNVSAYSAIARRTVNIADVYETDEFDFTGPREYDSRTGYRTKSMLVVPMIDHKDELIGVLQLINATDPKTGDVIAFPEEIVDIVRALASQASVAIANASLIKETKELFESLIQVLAVAVDAKSGYTANHIQRVAEFTVWLAKAVNSQQTGPMAQVHFSEQDMEEIRLAGWLHDVGKVTTPVWVMDKATKLQTIMDRMELLKLRFDLIKSEATRTALQQKNELLLSGNSSRDDLDAIDQKLKDQLKDVADDFAFIEQCNNPGEFMEDEKIERLKTIASKAYTKGRGKEPNLTDDEIHNLSIRKGSLTEEQMNIMKDHVAMTVRMLEKVPFKGGLADVPLYAGQHHEKLNGRGYPYGLEADSIPVQSRILAIADFYEALSAKDRPYKKPMPEEQVISILSKAAEFEEIDGDILELMIDNNVHGEFEKAYEEKKDAVVKL